jgi:hypothetical protein
LTTRVQRLKKLLVLQEQLKAVHEMRHAGFVAGAVAARKDAAELVDRFNAEDSLSGLFPDIYHRGIGSALTREDTNRKAASSEAHKIATATVRTNMVERTYREARSADERQRADSERLEIIAQRLRRATDK